MRQNFKSIARSRTIVLKAAFTFLLFGLSLSGLAQYRADSQDRPVFTTFRHDPGLAAQGHYPGSQFASTSFTPPETNFTALFDQARREAEQPDNYQSATYQELLRRQCVRAVQEEDARFLENSCGWPREEEQDAAPHASPEAPDQSELLKNSKDRDFILRNFRTMYVDARDAKYFGSRQLKAALGKNKDFWKLNVRMVDDPRVADVILKVSYTFAWDYPFELTHRNTTMVLLSGKGEGPFSGPLGAADVARNLVNLAKPWREEKKETDN
ncbi:MAG TPA: hypothetical protein VF938_08905 [Candidatus Angelobacter sp.]